jgi:acetyltransferase-like isoleucine patch superfamily enzyme
MSLTKVLPRSGFLEIGIHMEVLKFEGHKCKIGNFCSIAEGCRILPKRLGNHVSIWT